MATESAVKVSLSGSGGTLIHSHIAAGLDGFWTGSPAFGGVRGLPIREKR